MRLARNVLINGWALFAILANVVAQGADDCASAQAILGVGTYPFDNSSSTTDGPSDCQVVDDVWFSWTAPYSGVFELSTCALASFETQLAIYEGDSCTSLSLVSCATQDCGTGQQKAHFLAQQGQEYLLRLGSSVTGVGGTGTFTIGPALDCANLPDDSFEPNDTQAEAVIPLEMGLTTGLVVTATSDDWYPVTVSQHMTLQVEAELTMPGSNFFLWLYDDYGDLISLGEPVPNVPAPSGARLSWDNPGYHETVYLRVLSLLGSGPQCHSYDLDLREDYTDQCVVSSIGWEYCLAQPNSTGRSAVIDADGSRRLSDQELSLCGVGLPDNVPGMFFYGRPSEPIPFGQGVRCVGQGPVQRIRPIVFSGPANGNPAGVARLDFDFGAAYAAALMPVHTGFQLWYRDQVGGHATFNLTNAIRVSFY